MKHNMFDGLNQSIDPKHPSSVAAQAHMAKYNGIYTESAPFPAAYDPRAAQLLALFDKLDERGKTTTLAMLAVAVKLHPKELK